MESAASGIGGLVHVLRGFQQQRVHGLENGAFAAGFGGVIFKGAGFPGENPPERRFAAHTLGLGVNQFAFLNPQFCHERAAADAQDG